MITQTADGGDSVVDIIVVNMNSFALKRFLHKNNISTEKEIKFQTDRYFTSICLHSLYLFSILQGVKKNDEQPERIDLEDFVSAVMKPYAHVLLYENDHITKYAFDRE